MSSFKAMAQGLEKIIVEKYYISDDLDQLKSNGSLVSGSITYRIFVDMKAGYRFQAAYGIPGHPLSISTSTYFFNDNNYGSSVADNVLPGYLKKGVVMLDSWLSVGAGAENMFAILKSSDTTSAIVSSDSSLQNSNPLAGDPLRVHDGLLYASPLPKVLIYGIDAAMLKLFDKGIGQKNGEKFYTENGSWACLNGAIGFDSTNTVLIAQITTNGQLTFSLNLQIGSPAGGVENYVSSNPMSSDKYLSELNYPLVAEKIKSGKKIMKVGSEDKN